MHGCILISTGLRGITFHSPGSSTDETSFSVSPVAHCGTGVEEREETEQKTKMKKGMEEVQDGGRTESLVVLAMV